MFLISAKSHGVNEDIRDIMRVFGPAYEEISDIEKNCIDVKARKTKDIVLFAGSFNMIYEITAEFGASGTYYFPW